MTKRNILLAMSCIFSIIITILLTVFVMNTFSSNSKFPTKEAIAGAYIVAIQQSNYEDVKSLIPDDHKADNEIESKINQAKNKELRNYTLIYKESGNPYFGTFEIENEDKTFVDQINVEKKGDRWYLILGTVNNIADIPTMNNELTESIAVSLIQAKYPSLTEYPSDNLPPRSIKSEYDKASSTWYVGFIQEGSGVPIISAKCFAVSANQEIKETGSYENTETLKNQISVRNCQ
ncbi:MAG: hypothetical protein ACOCXT_04055 [Candidatus Dojkabacteria bacterium]